MIEKIEDGRRIKIDKFGITCVCVSVVVMVINVSEQWQKSYKGYKRKNSLHRRERGGDKIEKRRSEN